ncbi:MAG: hypothetical protein JNM27_13205 [Leptospirales bacterium]|nr:hypothetical protein [Leptospirales bacterium]
MIRSGMSLVLVGVVAFACARMYGTWSVLPHVLLGAASVLLFDALRHYNLARYPLRAVSIASLGTFVRVMLLGTYGIIHMFFATPATMPALMTFLISLLACLFFGVAWETGSSILSHRK